MFSDLLNALEGLFRALLRGCGNGIAGAAHEGGGLILQTGIKKSGNTKDVGKTREEGTKEKRNAEGNFVFCLWSSRLHKPQGIKSHLIEVLLHCPMW